MKFCWVTLNVTDFNKSLEFYNGILGIPVCSQYEGVGMRLAMLGEEDKPKIEIIQTDSYTGKPFSSGITVGLEVESLDKIVQYLKIKKIDVIRGPFSPNSNIKFLYINDPDGYEVQLVEIIK